MDSQKIIKIVAEMPYFKAKMLPIQFRLGLRLTSYSAPRAGVGLLLRGWFEVKEGEGLREEREGEGKGKRR